MPVHRSPKRSDIIVIGASMGGFHPLKELIRGFPVDLPAAVFVVLHTAPERKTFLAEIFGRGANVPVADAQDGQAIEQGHVYLAVPDFHLRVDEKRVLLDHGPRQNFARPAVDALFSSAAKAFGRRVVGVVLSGALDDGTAGLLDIKRHGGIAVVQNPSDATNPSMPASALDCVPVDHCVPLAEMGRLLLELAGRPVRAFRRSKMRKPSKPELSTHICPECNGPMWFVEDGKLLHFHCRIGHYFSGQSLLVEKTMALESALWSAVNALKDKADISTRLAKRARSRNEAGVSGKYFREQAANSTSHAKAISEMLLDERSPVTLGTKRTTRKKR